jgi:replicative DNA helicase
MVKKDRSTLGYLGQAFQLKFIGQLLTDEKYANSVIDLVKPEYFDDAQIRRVVMHLKDNHERFGCIPDYISMEGILRNETSGHQLEHCLGLLTKSKEFGFNNSLQIQDVAKTFFKQQETIKVAKEILKIAEEGDTNKYHLCEDLLRKALEFGIDKDEIIDVFDDIDGVLSDDFRKPVPTGIIGLDSNMGGGLSKGELGVILAAFGVGKAQPLHSKILTPNGWVTMGDIKIGDKVISRDGKSCNVTGVFPQGKRPIYKISFNDGTETLCDEEHLWSVNTINQRNRSTKKDGKNITLPPDNTYKTLSTINMYKNVKVWNNRRLNYKIPNISPVEFDKKELSINPYLLGVIIGDGCITIHNSPHFVTKDVEIIENVRKVYENISVSEHTRLITKKNGEIIKRSLIKVSLLNMIQLLKGIGLYGSNSKTKFIPKDYLYTSVSDRVKLLQGLVDTDGYIDKHRCEISTVSETLSLNIKELVQSLGGKVKITTKIGKYDDIECSLVYRIGFSFPNNGIIPSLLTRKINRFKPRTKYSDNKFIKSIEYYGEEEAKCIMVDNPEHLYVTDDYIVTHNTTAITKIANTAKNHGQNVLQIFFEDNPKVIRRKHYSCWTGISLNDLQDRRAEVKEKVMIEQSKPGIIKLKKFPSDGTTIPMIRQYIRKQIAQGFRPDVILIDYIDCITPSRTFTDNNIAEGNIMRQFESLLDELQMVGWTAIQGNRSSIGADLVEANQIGGSIKKGQIGHFIVSIAKTLTQKEDHTATIAILKSRFGPDGIIFRNCIFNNATVQIETSDDDNGASFSKDKEVMKVEDGKKIKAALTAIQLRKQIITDETVPVKIVSLTGPDEGDNTQE